MTMTTNRSIKLEAQFPIFFISQGIAKTKPIQTKNEENHVTDKKAWDIHRTTGAIMKTRRSNVARTNQA